MKTSMKDRGNALVTVLILTAVAGIMAGALISYTMSERKLNRLMLLRLQAQDAAQATLEYGASQIAVLSARQVNMVPNYFASHPINFYSTRAPAFFSAGTSVNSANNYIVSDSASLWVSQPTALALQQIPAGRDGFYKPDLLSGVGNGYARTQTVTLLAQATAADGNGNTCTNYAMETLAIRQVPLDPGIFYNVPMEFHPTSSMDVYGPVFSNQNVFMTVGAGNKFVFHGTFKTAGLFFAYPMFSDAKSEGNNRPVGQDIYFTNGGTGGIPNPTHFAGDPNDFYDINHPFVKYNETMQPLGTWADSGLDTAGSPNISSTGFSFGDVASQLWKGQVADGNMGVTQMLPPGVVADDPASAHKLIEPADPTADSSNILELSKFSRKAGLYIVVEPNDDVNPTGAVVTAFYNPADALSYEYSNQKSAAKRNASARAAWLDANPGRVVILPAGVVNTKRLMYDTREKKTLNTVDIDVGQLAAAIGTDPKNPPATTLQVNGSAWDIDNTNGKNQGQWNGVVYVDVQTDQADSNPTDGSASMPGGWATTSDIMNGSKAIQGTGTETAVRLVNGATLPNRGSADQYGMTVATNAPVYVIGAYNGNQSTTLTGEPNPTPDQVQTPDSNEAPAMIAGDSINLFSNAWWTPSNPTYPDGAPTGDAIVTKSDGTGTGNIAKATPTEYAAALVSGDVATTDSGGKYSYSGGVENYMRLNEDWQGDVPLRLRGSLIALYYSQVATGVWPHTGPHTYIPPHREWAYDYMFAGATTSNSAGLYADGPHDPPGCPRATDIQLLTYSDLSEAEFKNMLGDKTNYNFTKMK